MHWNRILAIPVFLACAIPAVTAPIPQVNPQDRTHFFHDITVEANDTANVVQCFGCNVHVRGHVTGDIVTGGGSIYISGPVDGDVLAVGGHVDTKAGGQLHGNAIAIGGYVTASGGGTIDRKTISAPYAIVPGQYRPTPRGIGILIVLNLICVALACAILRPKRVDNTAWTIWNRKNMVLGAGLVALFLAWGFESLGRYLGPAEDSARHVSRLRDYRDRRCRGRRTWPACGRSGIPKHGLAARHTCGNFRAHDARSDPAFRLFRFFDRPADRARRRDCQWFRLQSRAVRGRVAAPEVLTAPRSGCIPASSTARFNTEDTEAAQRTLRKHPYIFLCALCEFFSVFSVSGSRFCRSRQLSPRIYARRPMLVRPNFRRILFVWIHVNHPPKHLCLPHAARLLAGRFGCNRAAQSELFPVHFLHGSTFLRHAEIHVLVPAATLNGTRSFNSSSVARFGAVYIAPSSS